MTDKWNVADLPDQTGRTIVVTGPTLGGLGHHTALELARRGARVILAGRNPAKVEETVGAIRAEVPDASLEALHLDLASLGSVRTAAAAVAQVGAIDVLVNNAGVMGTSYSRTADGLELQLATNHFGPFLLTGLLLPQLVQSGDGRVVTVSSMFHHFAGKAPLGDPREQRGRYSKWRVYGQSKLANLLFTAELDRRLTAAGLPVRALAAHPGFAGTHLAANGQYGRSHGGIASILDAGVKAVSQSAAAGAWPSLMAATSDLPGNTFVGPSGLQQMSGTPRIVGRSKLARDEGAARRLWEISEETVDLEYP
ncbi:oxidoreductase [Pimelobacter simplex]|uniref:Putative oxidoreductase/Short-chain dehydrogenase n=3 Tax=Nocardioides simplex TaxID=2045 RepID=A0A0A1DR64_NOCSI|nr:oxidoreductase [Pimelobacter simplex]AIY19087.1 putative oxidoreductase/Short-chain dehydrogenase [Pimelobacter simplex]SFM23701.1 Short-chain dehydrogenase [Pimelobacter simplex]